MFNKLLTYSITGVAMLLAIMHIINKVSMAGMMP